MKENHKLVIRKVGLPFRQATDIVATAIPDVGTDEVLIRNHFAGVNGVYDQMMCFDRIDHMSIQPPANTGVEAVGVIVACGSQVTDFSVGDPVATVVVGNGYSLYQTCSIDDVVRIPAATPDVLALIPSGVSGLLALERVGEMKTEETVCVTAAAGGLGNIMVQLALNAGNTVVAICGDDAKAAALDAMGAQRVIQYRKESVRKVIEAEFKDRLDLVMESVGGEVFDILLDNLAPFGRLVVCGFTSDRLPPETIEQQRIYTKLYWKAASVRGFMNYRFAEFAPDARERLLRDLGNQQLAPLLEPTQFQGLESVADAVELLLAGKNCGKVYVDLRS